MFVLNVVLYLIQTEKIKFKTVFVMMGTLIKEFLNVHNVDLYVPLVMIYQNVLHVNTLEMIID